MSNQTPTEFWIYNPTREQADLAIPYGASGCTNNPSYTQKMVDHPIEGYYALNVMDDVISETEKGNTVAEFQRRLVKPIRDNFLPLFVLTGGRKGYVSIQGDPIYEDDPDIIIQKALDKHKLAPNICCKIPTTISGLKAMEYLINQDIPLNATEIFGIRQAVVLWEKYIKVSKKCGKTPMLYISHIAGIYDDYLQNKARKERIKISGMCFGRPVWR